MRALKDVSRGLVVLAWSVASLGQQPTPAPPAADAETRSPPPAGADGPAPPPAGREAATPPPATAPVNADEGEFIPSEELAPDAAVTFPVDI